MKIKSRIDNIVKQQRKKMKTTKIATNKDNN